MNTLETLEAARDLLRDPENWTKGCSGMHGISDKWCIAGAINRVSYPDRAPDYYHPALKPVNQVAERLGDWDWVCLPPAVNYNDHFHRQHAEILELLNLTIAELQGAQCATTGEKSNTTMPPTDTGSSTPVENELLSPV